MSWVPNRASEEKLSARYTKINSAGIFIYQDKKWLFKLKITNLTITSKNGSKVIVILFFHTITFKLFPLGIFSLSQLFITDNLESYTLHKITISLIAGSQTAAPLKWMVSSEPNSIKGKAIFKSQFYYTATCLTPLNILPFVGTSTVSNDLQLPWAYEYSMAVLQMLPVKTFLRLTVHSVVSLHVFSLFLKSFIPWWSQLVGSGVDNYCLIKKGLTQDDIHSQHCPQLCYCSDFWVN